MPVSLDSPQRLSLWKEVLRLKVDILCVQETHYHTNHTLNLQNKLFPHIYTASASLKQRGVLIAIKNAVVFSLKELHTGPEGRYLIIICELNNKLYTVAALIRTEKTPNPLLAENLLQNPHLKKRCINDMWEFTTTWTPLLKPNELHHPYNLS